MARRGDIARAVAAAVMLAAVLVGLPALLVLGVGWPLPTAVPRLSHLADTVSGHRPLETPTVWKVLALALWLAWAQVLAAVVVELVALSRGALPRALPGLGLGHGLAAPLVAAIVVAWPTGGTRAAATPAPAAVARPRPPEVAVTPEPEPPPASSMPAPAVRATVDHVVQRRDNLWDLAERYLGDGHRAGELFELNRGRPQPDGEVLTDPGLLRPGWVLRVPARASAPLTSGAAVAGQQVTVQTGDTLWDLAAEHLGDGHRYHDLVALNRGRAQPDGQALTRADLIEPGWVLELPQATPPPRAASAQHQAPDTGVVSAEPSPLGTPGETELPAPPPSPAVIIQEQAPLGEGAETEPAIAEPPNQPAGEAPAEDDGDDVAQPVGPVGLLAGGVGTAGLVVLLNRRRRAQQRRRPRGRRLPPPEAPLVEAERALRAGTDIEASALVEAALRAAAVGSEGGLPPLRWVEAAADAVTLVVDSDRPAPPGFADDGRGRWRASASTPELDGLGQAAASPVPALVPVGATELGSEVLIDLESSAVTTVVGDAASTGGFLRATAVAAATAPWRDHARILLVGRGSELAEMADTDTTECLDDALDELERRADAAADALAELGCAGTAQARGRGFTPDAWTPLVVIATAPAQEHQLRRLIALARRPACGIAVVTVAPARSQVVGRAIEVDADGCLRIEGVDLALRPRRLDVDDVAVVTELLSSTEEPDAAPAAVEEPPPRTPLPAPVATGASALEALLSEVDVVVRVLGPVEAVRLSPDGEQRLAVPKQKSLEAIAYLALREGHVDRDDLQAALWPGGANSAKTFHNTIWGARKALGIDRDGAEAFPEPAGGLYWLSRRVVTDYGLFHELVSRAAELDHAEVAAALLAEALTLVQGEPFVGLGRGYCWVAPHAGIIVAQVVDAAEELAEMRLTAGDWRAAEWAARQGLRVFPCEERLYRLLMRCAHAAGSGSGVHRVFQELVTRLADPDDGVEPEDTVHPDTVALLDQLEASHSRPHRASA
ncbi:MAG: LysM peptidoglycan-binding domain-containing protein [Actinobacteria bacterium]|nr:LysM peptidoglycan-binding domain-containing protein [Actinomycetota bacterium]